MITEAQLRGITKSLAAGFAEQRRQSDAQTAALELRILALEAAVGALIAPLTIAQVAQPSDGAPAARH